MRALGEPPVADVHHAVGMGSHVGLVRDEHDGLARVAQALERGEHHVARGGVEVARGLVGQDEGRVVHEGPRDGDALLLAAGELVAAMVVQPLGDGHAAQRRMRPQLALLARAGRVDERQHHVAQHGGARQQVERNIYLQIIEILKLIQFIRSGCINFSISTEQKKTLYFFGILFVFGISWKRSINKK